MSKALSGRPEVNEDTRARILSYAKELGYAPSAGRSALNTVRVAIVIEDTDNTDISSAFFYDTLLGFKHYAKQRGFEVIILSITTDEQNLCGYDEFVLTQQLDGAFVMGLKTTDPYYRQLSDTKVPSVALDIVADNLMVGSVGVDNITGARLAVEHLVSLGHRRIGFLNGHSEAYVSQERLSGYMAAMCRCGLGYDSALVFEGDYTTAGGALGADYFIKTGATAIFCASDLMALGAIRRLQEIGVKVPGDISIVGFDNASLCEVCMPPLTTLAQDRTRIGITACALLDGLMRGVPINRTVLQPELIIRGSTGKATE